MDRLLSATIRTETRQARRTHYDRGSLASTLAAAAEVAAGLELSRFVFETAFGFTVCEVPPEGGKAFFVVRVDGGIEAVGA